MRRAFLLLWLLLACTPIFGAASAFDPKEKISIVLQDAKISDLAATLAALANLPVYVDPDVSGTVTIQLENVPFEQALRKVSATTGIWIRIESGKLVASRSADSLFALATLPDAFRNAPRMAISDYEKARSALPPVFVQLETGGWRGCYRMDFRERDTSTLSGPIGIGDAAIPLFLTQFAYEPLSKIRFFGLEYGTTVAATGFESGKGSSYDDTDSPGGIGLKVVLSEKPREGCKEPTTVRAVGPARAALRFEVRSVGNDGSDETVMAPQMRALAGQTFVVRSEIPDEKTGQHRQIVVSGYVARDGRSIAAVLTATAIWIDPEDGREYYFVQPEKPTVRVRLHSLTSEGVIVCRLTAGVATPRPLILRVYGGEPRKGAVD